MTPHFIICDGGKVDLIVDECVTKKTAKKNRKRFKDIIKLKMKVVPANMVLRYHVDLVIPNRSNRSG